MSIRIERLQKGIYRLYSQHDEDVTLLAQDLRSIYDWCLQHMAELPSETKEEEEEEED